MAAYAYELPIGNNWHWGFRAKYRLNAFADKQAAVGVVGLRVFLSSKNKKPTALDGSLDVIATEVAPGDYAIVFYGVDTLRALEDNYVGRVIYLCIQLGTQLIATIPVLVTLAQLP